MKKQLFFTGWTFFMCCCYAGNPIDKAALCNNLRGNGMKFTQNMGQVIDESGNVRPDVLYSCFAGNSDLYLRTTGISYVLSNLTDIEKAIQKKGDSIREKKDKLRGRDPEIAEYENELRNKSTVQVHRVDLDFVGANFSSPTPQEQVEGYSNYFYPHCPNGISRVKSYNKITFNNIYPNIDLVYYGGQEQGLKYDIILNRGGNPDQVKLKYSGATTITLENGKLRIQTSVRDIGEYMPKVYQDINGKIVDVEAEYVLKKANPLRLDKSEQGIASSDKRTGNSENPVYLVTFKLGIFNPDLPLIIDPWVLCYGSGNGNLGNSGDVTTDSLGYPVFTGQMAGSYWPATPGAFQTTFPGSTVAVVKFSPQGTLDWSTFYGSPANFNMTIPNMIRTDNHGNVYVVGQTSDTDFPIGASGSFNGVPNTVYKSRITINAKQNKWSAFIFKLDSSGTKRLWSSYYGGGTSLAQLGPPGTYASSVAIDHAGNAILYGTTTNTDSIATTATTSTTAAYQSTPGNLFLAKFSPTGNLLWGTYYGGPMQSTIKTQSTDIACDAGNNIYFTGSTSDPNFPVSGGAFQSVYNVGGDAFLVKMDPTGTSRPWATLYGGSGNALHPTGNSAQNVVVDHSGNPIITGNAVTTTNIATSGAYQAFSNAGPPLYESAYLVKFNSAGSRQWGTYLGGSGEDYANGIGVDSCNNIVIGGAFFHVGSDFPTLSCTAPFQTTSIYGTGYNSGLVGNFISTFRPDGTLLCSTTFANSTGVAGEASYSNSCIAVHGLFVYYLSSAYCPWPTTPGAYSTCSASGKEGLAQMYVNTCGKTPAPAPTKTFSFTASPATVCVGQAVDFTSVYTNSSCESSTFQYSWTFPGGTPRTSTEQNPSGIVFPGSSTTGGYPKGYPVKLVVTTFCTKDSITNPIIVNASFPVTLAATSISCQGGTSVITSTPTGGTGTYAYNWAPSGGTGQTSTGVTAGTYTVSVSDGSTCGGLATITVTEPSAIVIDSISGIVAACKASNGTAITYASGGTNPLTYSWSTAAVGQTISGVSAGSYTVTVTDGNGCTQMSIAAISNPSPTIKSLTTGPPICLGGDTGIATVVASGGSGILTYNWSNGLSGITQTGITGLKAGTYEVSVTDALGCLAVSAVTISSNGPTVTVLNSGSICAGKTNGGITVSTTGSVISYTWSPGAVGTTSVSNLVPGNYTVTVADANNCTATGTAVIIALPDPTVKIGANQTITKGQSVQLNASGGITYLWTPATGLSNTTIPNPLADPLKTATYTVMVTDASECSAIDSVQVTVMDAIDCDSVNLYQTIFMPTAFSPNGDGKNDILYLHAGPNSCVMQLKLLIYDQWGELVFETTNPIFGWDGKFRGKVPGTSVFMYYLTISLSNGESLSKKGNITLLR